MRLLILTITVLSLVISFSAQSDPIRVGDYRGTSATFQDLKTTIELFAARLAKEPPLTRGAITYANSLKFSGPCVDDKFVEDEAIEKFIRKKIPKNVRKRIVLIPAKNLGLRPEARFYLVPNGARMPTSLEPIVDLPCCCPEIRIIGPSEVDSQVKRIKFRMDLRSRNTPLKALWSISEGAIVRGQGTKSIEVQLPHKHRNEIVVSVVIDGVTVRCNCPAEASFVTRIGPD